MRALNAPVLLVDDRRPNLDALEALLDASDYELESVTSGAAALAALEKRDFAVVLLDLQMPTMDGFETARRMRRRAAELGRHAPIIVVTASDADHSEVLRSYACGAVDFLRKPLDPDVLAAKVAIFAELYGAMQRAQTSDEKLARKERANQEEAERFRLLVESVKDYAIFMLDPRGFVTSWNLGAERIKGYASGEIVGKHFSTFYPPEDITALKCDRELEIATHEGRFEEEGWRLRKDGSRFWANVTITALRNPLDNELVGFAKVTRDLTARVEHEETRRHLAAEMAMLAEKAKTQEFQERFVAILGHDLRNPLSAIDMGTTLLTQRAADANDTAAMRILQRMRGSSRRMSRMIAQILDLTRTRLSGGIELEIADMDLSATLRAIVDELRTAHPSRVIELDSPPEVAGRWDADRLEQVFSNLVSNAVHYGLRGRPILIVLRDETNGITVTVHNDGPPIPERTRAELFSAFRRGTRDSRAPETAGLGLGLYISREIVLAHGGDLNVDSRAVGGTTFSVTLPRAVVAEAAS